MEHQDRYDVIIVGAGLSGLSCAHFLTQQGKNILLLDRAERVGGRVQTDEEDGFLFDRGFQVFLSAYPLAQQMFDRELLGLGWFQAGAAIWKNGSFHTFLDPFQHPLSCLTSLNSSFATIRDKYRLFMLRRLLLKAEDSEIFSTDEMTSEQYLRHFGFSADCIDTFFRPFLGGVFLDPTLTTSSRMLHFVLKMFFSGKVGIPRRGMRALPEHLAARLPTGVVKTKTTVDSVSPHHVVLAHGEKLFAKVVVVATDAVSAPLLVPSLPLRRFQSVENLYFRAKITPLRKPLLVLNGERSGVINNLTVLSEAQPSYAPKGESLISVSVLNGRGYDLLEPVVRAQLSGWFGPQVRAWQFLRSYTIPRALPEQLAPLPRYFDATIERDGIICAGDYITHGSIEGALISGKSAASLAMKKLEGV